MQKILYKILDTSYLLIFLDTPLCNNIVIEQTTIVTKCDCGTMDGGKGTAFMLGIVICLKANK